MRRFARLPLQMSLQAALLTALIPIGLMAVIYVYFNHLEKNRQRLKRARDLHPTSAAPRDSDSALER